MIQEYIGTGPPYLGESGFKDKELVKSLGARWNGENKKWAAGSREALAQLIRSNKWLPTGFTYHEAISMLQVLEKPVETKAASGGMKFDRRGENDLKFNPRKDKEVALNGSVLTYARFCDDCNVLMDSRLQFGLECDCAFGCAWNACNTCFMPVKYGDACPHCK
jgi:hypothetical protein